MNLGELIDHRAGLKRARAEAQAIVDGIDDEAKEIERQIIALMRESNLGVAAGSIAKVVLKEDLQPNAKDWDKVYEYIRTNNAFYLLQKRLAAGPLREMHNAGQTIDGVELVPVRSISLTSL